MAQVCDRYGISNTTVAAVANAILQDYSLLNDQNTVDRNKLWRARETRRKELKNISTKQPKSLYFDGRKDKTLQNTGMLSIEEHITILEEPHNKFLTHSTPVNSTSNEATLSIINSLETAGVTFNSLLAIGCDRTVVNTGNKNWIIAKVEKYVGCPLQHLICLLHLNELPLRHLLKELDLAFLAVPLESCLLIAS